MKGKILRLAAALVSGVAVLSVQPLCMFIFHQPKVPSQLINR